MSQRTQENIVSFVLLAFFVVMLYLTFQYSSRARLVPLPVCVIGIVLVLAQLVWQNLRSADELHVNFLDILGRGSKAAALNAARSEANAAIRKEAEAEDAAKSRLGGDLAAFGLIIALLGLVFITGPLPAVFIFTAGYLSLTRHCTPARAVLYAALCAGVLYGLFGYALGVQLNRGLLSMILPDYVDF